MTWLALQAEKDIMVQREESLLLEDTGLIILPWEITHSFFDYFTTKMIGNCFRKLIKPSAKISLVSSHRHLSFIYLFFLGWPGERHSDKQFDLQILLQVNLFSIASVNCSRWSVPLVIRGATQIIYRPWIMKANLNNSPSDPTGMIYLPMWAFNSLICCICVFVY